MKHRNKYIRYIGIYSFLLVTGIFTNSRVQAQDAGMRVESSSGTVYLNIGSNVKLNITAPGNAGGVLLGSGGSIDNSGTMNLAAGTWINNGNGLVNGSTGIVQMNNSSTQPVQGSTPTVFYDLEVNNAAGVSLNKDVQVTHALVLAAGNLSIGSHTLTVNGSISGSGTISGTAASNLVLGGTAGTINFTAGSRSLNNLTLNNGSSAVLGTALDVYGTITLNTASLDLAGKNLTLKSNAANTARIADLTGSSISGATNITMERYIKLRAGGDGRAYRLLAPTVNTSGSINANWMEGGMNTAIGTNVNPVPGYGTQITGSGGNANGFDKTQSNAASLYNISNAAVPAYTAITNAGSTLNAKTGYFLYVRGDRNQDMTLPLASNMPTSATTLRTTGALVTGTQNSFTNTFTGGGALNLVTNPYPSPIDWSLVKAASSNITNYYTLWDPNVGTRGGFVTVSSTGVASSGLATQYIQPGQAFFVESNGAGTPAVTIMESHKTPGNNNDVFITPPPPAEGFRSELYFTEPNGYRRVADAALALFNDGYSAETDENDAREINNWDENIAIARAGKHLAIECRPVILSKDSLPLFMNNMKERSYEFQFEPTAFTNIGLKAELVDNFLHSRTVLSVVNTTVVPFTITADAASKASDRFMIVFGPQAPLAIDVMTIKAQAKYQPAAIGGNGIQIDWTAKTETNMDRYEVERSFTGGAFSKINTMAAVGNSQAAVNYNWFDQDPQNGFNYYRIKAIDKAGLVKYTNVVKVNFGKTEQSITIYPNPVSNNIINLQLTAMPAGNYQLRLLNSAGQLLFTQQLVHRGINGTQTIKPGNTLPRGNYFLEMIGPDGWKMTRVLSVGE